MPHAHAWVIVYRPSFDSPDVIEDEVYTTTEDPAEAVDTIFSEFPNAVIEELHYEGYEELSEDLYEELFG
jgi:hypothetical protein